MRGLLVAAVVGAWTTSAWAQFGLYGSPDAINLPQGESTVLPESSGSATPASYSSNWPAQPAPNQAAYPIVGQPVAQGPLYAPATRPVAGPAAYPSTGSYPAAAFYPPTTPIAGQPIHAPALQQAYAPAPQQAYASGPQLAPQQGYAPAPQLAPQQAYAPAPQLVPQQAYAPAPQQAYPRARFARPGPAYGYQSPARPQAPPAAPTPAPVPPPPAMPSVPPAPTMQPVPAPAGSQLVPQPAQGGNMVDQMLNDPNGCGPGDYAGGQGVYAGCGTDQGPIAQAVNGGCAPDYGACAPCDVCPWYASATVLVMGRNEPNHHYFSCQADNNSNQCGLVNTVPWQAGGEIRFGRRFCCGTWAVEAAYWTLVPSSAESSCSFPNGVNTPINLDFVQFYRNDADWDMATDIIDGAIEHRLRRRNEFHSIEINLLREGMLCDPCHALDVNWGVGVRYFRFEEDLVFGARHNGAWGSNGGRDEAFIDQNLRNNLIGVQFTVDLNYYIQPNWRVFLTPRFGLYDNHIEENFRVYRGDGTVARSTDPQAPGSYPVNTSTDTVAFLTQLDVGVGWSFARNWSAAIGYRVVAATGIGLADNQVPPYLVDMAEVRHIDFNGELILHGGFASLTYNF
jgi:hypothetical protein